MKIKHLLSGPKPSISFEFFPPKTDEAMTSLLETIDALKDLSPSYVSITYGAGGSTRQKTIQLVSKIKNEIQIEAMAHLTCVGHTREDIFAILKELASSGVENILALRGDPPKGQSAFVQTAGGFAHASELVKFIHDQFSFCIGVAGYPEKHIEASHLGMDIEYFSHKVSLGADFGVTQLFFDNARYFSYVDLLKKRNVHIPIIPGIMPITDAEQAQRFAQMCGATLPQNLLSQLSSASSKDQVVQIGIDFATAQCIELIERKVPGIHFYTLNKSQSTKEIFSRLKKLGYV